MTDLPTWLRAQLDEDERVAREALHPDAVNPGSWTTEHHNSETHSEPNRCHIAEDRAGRYWSVAHEVFIPNAEHMARHDPARVLVEVDAKRKIIDECEVIANLSPDSDTELAKWVLRALALPYADRQEWKP
jgi:hypothetical protein